MLYSKIFYCYFIDNKIITPDAKFIINMFGNINLMYYFLYSIIGSSSINEVLT